MLERLDIPRWLFLAVLEPRWYPSNDPVEVRWRVLAFVLGCRLPERLADVGFVWRLPERLADPGLLCRLPVLVSPTRVPILLPDRLLKLLPLTEDGCLPGLPP